MKRHLFIFLFSILTAVISTACSSSKASANDKNDDKKPQNVILMIGDGMSTPQIYAYMLTSETPTSFERFPITGLVKTFSKSNKITDSAAGGTAIATGHKTNNGMIGMNADSIAVPSMLDLFAEKGMNTGVVVTSYITHATPAAFLAKNINRNNYEEIALDIANNDKVNILIGGGRKHFVEREDKLNLIDEMVADGWVYYDTLEVGNNYNYNKNIIILADDGHMSPYPERGNFLPDATSFALEKLSKSGNGFFLMIEGSQIDFAGHDNDSTYLVNEMHDFNITISKVLDFAQKDQNTLVIVTADHETGGLTIVDPNQNYTKTNFHFSNGSHSPLLVPIFAYGPGADNFSGIIDNTDIIEKIQNIYNK